MARNAGEIEFSPAALFPDKSIQWIFAAGASSLFSIPSKRTMIMTSLKISWSLSDGRLTANWSEQASAQPIAHAGSVQDANIEDNRLPRAISPTMNNATPRYSRDRGEMDVAC